jgi:hypothetical protein
VSQRPTRRADEVVVVQLQVPLLGLGSSDDQLEGVPEEPVELLLAAEVEQTVIQVPLPSQPGELTRVGHLALCL